MIRVLFICHGNICRSPMAEFVMKKLVSDANLADHFQIASAATSTEEGVYAASGNSADCLMRRSRVLSGRLSSV